MHPLEIIIKAINERDLWNKNQEIRRNDYLLRAGQMNHNLYLIKKGSIRIFVNDGHEEHTIRFGYKNNLILALDTYVSGKPTEFFMQAIKKTEIVSTSMFLIEDLLKESPAFKDSWMAILKNFINQQMERERDLLISSPVERYRRVFERSPQLFQEIPHKYIAGYLRMTPETLSRIKKS